jgi:hypothetical protein
MAQVSGPQNVGIPGYKLPPKPKPVVGPQNVGIVGGGIGGYSNPGSLAGIPLSVAPAVAPAPAPPPPPPDFNALTATDPQFIEQNANLARQNQLTMAQLLNAFKGRAQSYQDNANAHGALFSGAAVNAQRSAAQGYSDQAAQQAQNYAQAQDANRNSVWNRILQQFAGGSA